MVPLPLNPMKQAQSKEPMVFVHSALLSQLLSPVVHSLISDAGKNHKNKWLVHYPINHGYTLFCQQIDVW